MPTARPTRSRAMSAAPLGLARTRAHLGLVMGIAVTIALSVALLCGLSAWIALDTRAALRAAFADDAESFAMVQTRVAADPTAQNAAGQVIRRVVDTSGAVIELTLDTAGKVINSRVISQATGTGTTPDAIGRLRFNGCRRSASRSAT